MTKLCFMRKILKMLPEKRVSEKNTGLENRKHKIRCSLILIGLVVAMYSWARY